LENNTIRWNVFNKDRDKIEAAGEITSELVPQGSVMNIGRISFSPPKSDKANRKNIHLNFAGALKENDYPIWIYPRKEELIIPDEILITHVLDKKAKDKLNKGGKVLLFPNPDDIKNNSVACQFISEFWNWGMFTWLAEQYGGKISPGTMGILTDPEHPVFIDFPTEFHTNWQWWPIVKNARSVILDNTDHGYRPLVQIIDNINRNHKLGMIFEFKVDDGKVLVCSSDLSALDEYPETRQLYKSILHYMTAPAFNPEYNISVNELKDLLFN
jgi:hypothetical protein